MAGSDPHCHQAAGDLVAILSELRKRELIRSPVSDETVRHSLELCQSCRGRGANPRKCGGWAGSFHQATAIVIPFEVKGRSLTAKVSGHFDFKGAVTTRGRRFRDWRGAPAAAASFSIELREVTGTRLCARYHVDLANRSQAGPVWHLQQGGLLAVEDREKDREWLDVPRWPALPMDMILMLELAIYNFRHDAWSELRASNPWRSIVKRSERLMHEHYLLRSDEYRARGDAGHSWLAYQCNATSGWDPRPA